MDAILEKFLLAYIRHVPISAGKYRLVERFGKGSEKDGFVRQAKLLYGDYTMECDLRKMLQRNFYFFGTYFLEQRVLSRWIHLAESARVVFDVGANAGIYSLAAASSNADSRVYAFEPTPAIADYFQSTVSRNELSNRIEILNCAVSRDAGCAYLNLFTGENNDNEGMNFISAGARAPSSVSVSTVSIDSFCRERKIIFIDLIKIDVQGHEPDVLAGAQDLIKGQALKNIFIELNWDYGGEEGGAASKVIKTLGDAGYKFANPAGHSDFRPAGDWLRGLSDVIASAEAD